MLDSLTRWDLQDVLVEVWNRTKVTAIMVTHDVDEAILLADRVVVLTPRPGQVRKILDVEIPRPRTLGRTAHLEDVARISAELHELLLPGGTDRPDS
jgi:NitT/TauT family transport system ATP-binding protein